MPEKQFSKSSIDRLGDRLRRGDVSEPDLRLLEDYRRSHTQEHSQRNKANIETLQNALEAKKQDIIDFLKEVNEWVLRTERKKNDLSD
jgi:hypothetical protein